MALPSSDDDSAMAPAAQVLTDPIHWRCITSFQHGLPLALYDFWVVHEPIITASKDRTLIRSGIHRLLALVVTHGTPQLLYQAASVWYDHGDRDGPSSWVKPVLYGVVADCIKANRADMLEAAIALDAPRHTVRHLLLTAIDFCHDGDVRVLDVLRALEPITAGELNDVVWTIKCVQVAQWFDLHYPGGLSMVASMESATREGNVAMVQYLVKHHPTMRFGTWHFRIAHQRGHFGILRYLLENRPLQVDQKLVAYLLGDDDTQVLQILRQAGGFHGFVHREAVRWISLGCGVDVLQRLFDEGLLTKQSEFSIDEPACSGKINLIQFLSERATVTATTQAMDGAASSHHWDVVEYLHDHRREGCTTAAMDAAAEHGVLRHVQFFHEKRTEGCTHNAMDGAAWAGALDVVKFLHDRRTEGCTTEAMDQAAGQGHLHVVRFLHEHRTEGCTTNAIDVAAQAGHMQVVKYLQTHRTEGCTVAAIKNAAKNGCLDIVRFLYTHYRPLFGPEVLYDLLLHGAFDIWMELRDQYPEEAGATVETVLLEAGRLMEYATIQFVIQQLGRHDLGHLAMDGAAKSCFHREAQWPRAVYAITGPGSCRLSAIQNAVAPARSSGDLSRLQFLVSVCSDRDLAITLLNETRELRLMGVKPETWQPPNQQVDDGANHLLSPLLLDVRSPSWAIALALDERRPVLDPFLRCKRPIPWAIQAINHGGDHRLLHVVRDLRSSGKLTAENQAGMCRFDGARAAAVRKGDLRALQWLLEHVTELPVEPTLLDEALFYHQFEIAEYLALHYPEDACRVFNWGNKPCVPWLGPCGLNMELLDWIETSSSAAVRNAVDFGDLASFAASIGELAVLKQLYASYPEMVMQRRDLRTRASEKKTDQNTEVIAFLNEIQYPY